MILVIIFSYNRAIQLEYLINSILARFKSPVIKIAVIYHTTGNHSEGYKKLIQGYLKFSNISFIERENQLMGLKSYLTTLYNIKNIKRVISYSRIYNKKSDNFKSSLEKLLGSTECEFVMFNTDDGFFFEDVFIPSSILDLIKLDPSNVSYRLFVGDNLDEFPAYITKNEDFYSWDYYFDSAINHWTYPFAVDGTVYSTKKILEIIRKVAYHNPITLEAYGEDYVTSKKLLKIGISPITSKMIATKLNRVASSTQNPTINISPDFLNAKYLEDYHLELELPGKIVKANVVPPKVFLIKGDSRECIYTIDPEGIRVQNALGIQGAKEELSS